MDGQRQTEAQDCLLVNNLARLAQPGPVANISRLARLAIFKGGGVQKLDRAKILHEAFLELFKNLFFLSKKNFFFFLGPLSFQKPILFGPFRPPETVCEHLHTCAVLTV